MYIYLQHNFYFFEKKKDSQYHFCFIFVSCHFTYSYYDCLLFHVTLGNEKNKHYFSLQ